MSNLIEIALFLNIAALLASVGTLYHGGHLELLRTNGWLLFWHVCLVLNTLGLARLSRGLWGWLPGPVALAANTVALIYWTTLLFRGGADQQGVALLVFFLVYGASVVSEIALPFRIARG